jgi:hypothetical protein
MLAETGGGPIPWPNAVAVVAIMAGFAAIAWAAAWAHSKRPLFADPMDKVTPCSRCGAKSLFLGLTKRKDELLCGACASNWEKD